MIKKLPLLLGIFALIISPAHASPWTQKKGEGLAILSANGYTAERYYDNHGDLKKQSRYRKSELTPYLEYGLRDGLTVGGSVALDGVNQQGRSHVGIGQSEIFARLRVLEQYATVASLANILRIPSPTSQDVLPVIGRDTPDVGLQFSLGRNVEAWGKSHYATLESAYFHRLGNPHDQVVINASFGASISERWTLVPEISTTRRVGVSGNPRFTLSAQDDYDLTTLRLSGVYALTDTWSLQLGLSQDAEGKNTGYGTGITLAVWKKF